MVNQNYLDMNMQGIKPSTWNSLWQQKILFLIFQPLDCQWPLFSLKQTTEYLVYIGKKYLNQMQEMLLFLYRNIARFIWSASKHCQNNMVDTLSLSFFVKFICIRINLQVKVCKNNMFNYTLFQWLSGKNWNQQLSGIWQVEEEQSSFFPS